MGFRIVPVNFFDEATISVTPSAVTTLPLANLQNAHRDDVWRSPNLDQQVITGHWDGNVRPFSSWGMWPAGERSSMIGAKVRVEGFSDLASATTVYDSGTLDFYTFTGEGWGDFLWGATPWGADEADRTAREAALMRDFAEVAIASFRITVTNGGAVDTPYFEARRFLMGQYVEAPYDVEHGVSPQWQSGSRHIRTPGGTLRRLRRARWREMRCELVLDTEATRAAWMDLMAVCAPDAEILIKCFGGEESRRARDFSFLGSLEALNPLIFQNPNFHRLQLSAVES